eukprot:gnl/MRDRNA2_/MRDRNA2_134778_c0_seq1.p1 gnl/MRDRNA2_/MRDRNA2_134778_c0~~gnl/MRDRNA2_/MRDRNA2_134778_c0_seq1.p1  ORF type:complete len:397 (+),score=53.80 gnl/MRDRNA2_/MRDRNA2_134778_c0_seq1:231-1421(+)
MCGAGIAVLVFASQAHLEACHVGWPKLEMPSKGRAAPQKLALERALNWKKILVDRALKSSTLNHMELEDTMLKKRNSTIRGSRQLPSLHVNTSGFEVDGLTGFRTEEPGFKTKRSAGQEHIENQTKKIYNASEGGKRNEGEAVTLADACRKRGMNETQIQEVRLCCQNASCRSTIPELCKYHVSVILPDDSKVSGSKPWVADYFDMNGNSTEAQAARQWTLLQMPHRPWWISFVQDVVEAFIVKVMVVSMLEKITGESAVQWLMAFAAEWLTIAAGMTRPRSKVARWARERARAGRWALRFAARLQETRKVFANREVKVAAAALRQRGMEPVRSPEIERLEKAEEHAEKAARAAETATAVATAAEVAELDLPSRARTSPSILSMLAQGLVRFVTGR